MPRRKEYCPAGKEVTVFERSRKINILNQTVANMSLI
jgi:hypothetical protein